MRRLLGALFCLLLILGPAAAEEEKQEEPKRPAEEMTEAERGAALWKAVRLSGRATALSREGRYREAIDFAREALEIRERVLGSERLLVATSLNSLALLLQAQGAYAEARPLYERALRIWERALGPAHPAVATCLNNLAGLLQAQGTYQEARPRYERALEIREKVFGPEHPTVATCLNNLASLLTRQGAYEEARPLHERALRTWEEALGPEHPAVATSLDNLAALLWAQGAYAEARPLYERALKIREKALGPEHPDVAASLNNLAGLLRAQGAYEEARPLYERALKVIETVLGPEHPHVATSLSNLAGLFAAQGAYEEARPLHERALEIRKRVFGPEHPHVATSLQGLAWLLAKQGASEEARRLHERALEIFEEALGPEHPDVATSLSNLASLREAQGAYEEARPLCERALNIWENALGPEHPRVALGLSNLAWLLAKLGRYERAGRLLKRSLRIVEGQVRRNLAGLLPSERVAFSHSFRFYLDQWLVVAPHLGRSGLATTLRFKGSLARVAAAERRIARSDRAEVRTAVLALRAAERRLAKLANAPPSFRDKKKKAAWQTAYAAAAAEREALARALQRDFAPLREGLERLDLDLADVQAHLAEDAVLLDFLRAGDEYVAWIVPPEGRETRVDLGDAEAIEQATRAFTEAAADPDDDAWRKAGGALRDLVLAPIAEHLDDHLETIHVCPDAALAAVPFGCLPNEGGLLGDAYRVSTLSMAQDLVPWPGAPPAGTGALVVGGVDYGEAAVGKNEAKAKSAFVDRAPRGRRFMYLPGTKAEAETIQLRLGEGTRTLFARQATENRLRAGVEGKRVLHLATHGFVLDDLMRGLSRRGQERTWLGTDRERQLAAGHDPMLLAGLALAGANPRRGGHGDDGILTALEASHLDLDGVELVVLSACQTALGKAESGEGVVGLAQGFQMAGAQEVVGSLWKVDDDATKALMGTFYELWSPQDGQGLPAADALRQAQTFVRSQPKWTHPYYWAAWVLWERR